MSRIIQIPDTNTYINLDNICTLEIKEWKNHDYLIINGVEIYVPDKRDTKNILEHWFTHNLTVTRENK